MRVFVALLVLATVAVAQDSPWTARALPADDGWTYAEAYSVNNRGEAAGVYSVLGYPNLKYQPIAWRLDEPGWIDLATAIGLPPGRDMGYGNSISDTGLVGGFTGTSTDPALSPGVAIVWDLDAGTWREVHPDGLGYNWSSISQIQDDGSAAGYLRLYDPGFLGQIGYYWGPETSPGRVLTPLDGFNVTWVLGLDSSGRCVGRSQVMYTRTAHATVWEPDGSTVDLHPEIVTALPPGEAAVAEFSTCDGIVDDGTIYGEVHGASGSFLRSWIRDAEGNVRLLDLGGRALFFSPGGSERFRCGNVFHDVYATREASIWVDGILHVLPPMTGFSDRILNDVNRSGVAVGNAVYPGGVWWNGSRAFVVEPRADGDFDGDALKDKWELQGYEHDNGTQVDLFGMGANPLRRDLFVEIDAMAGHRPDPETLQPVIDAFAAHDIALHLSIDDDLPLDANLGTLDGLGRYQWDEFDALKTAHFAEELESAVRYCVFAHRLATLTDSGLARGEPSSDFIVSLGAFVEESGSTDPWMQAGTFMHELGHTLGLRHGGADVTNRKPNYLSVMNYDFQKQGLRIDGQDGHFDYSRAKLADLDEGALLEGAGLGAAAAGYQTLYRIVTIDPVTFETTIEAVWSGDAQGAIDWDGSGGVDVATVAADINGNGATETLVGHHDWAALEFNGGTVGFGVGLPPPPPETEVVEELTVEEAKLIPPPPVEGLAGRAGRRSVRISWTPVGPYGQGTYKVYRWSDTAERELVAETQASLISDRPGRGTWTYVVTVTDSVGAESLDSGLLTLLVR